MAGGNHFLIRISQFQGQISGTAQLLKSVSKFIPVSSIESKSEKHVLAAGVDSYLMVYSSQGMLMVDAYSGEAVMVNELREAIVEFFSLGFNSAETINLAGSKGSIVECEEPGCTRPATEEYNGRKVCADHLDWYKEKEFQATTHHDF